MAESASGKQQRGIQSVEVGGALLRALAAADGPLSLGELSRRAGLAAAKAHPYLVSYGNLGLIVQDRGSGHYDFGPLALSIGLASLRRLNPLRLASERLPDLVAATGHTAALSVWGHHGPTVVHIFESDRPLHVNLRVGAVMSLLNTATGQVFAAFLPPAQIKDALVREGWENNPTIGAGMQPQRPMAKPEEVRTRRLARTMDHPQPGIAAFAAPILDHRGALAMTVTLLGPSTMFDIAWDGPLADHVITFARSMSEAIGARN